VELAQGDQSWILAEWPHEPLPPYRFWGPRSRSGEWTLPVGKESVPVGGEAAIGLREGQATLRVVAERASAWLRRPPPAVRELNLPVRLRPPSLAVTSTRTYVRQGGCEAVVYRVGSTSARDGVSAGEWFFPGFPLPGGDADERFALFAVPYDVADASIVRLTAEDEVGNVAEASFLDQFFPRPLNRDTIRVSDGFMERVVPAILSQTPELDERESLLASYLAINNELRAANAETLKRLAAESRAEFLWSRPFLAMPNAKVMSRFADRRTYLYEGREVDRQDHLGYDLASVRMAEVPAAGSGVVVLARYFGIYGNAVVIDHGFGLQSLYGHLSSVAVTEGQSVERGEAVGKTGATGLAGGDHLHFSMLLQGLPVDSKEWWDGHWIRDRIEGKLGQALPFED
jgi:murein DD-endopeptidase MepM/ murein hydrolase activator NlpD